MRHENDVCIGACNYAQRRAAMAMGKGRRLTGEAAEQAIRTALEKDTGFIRRGLQTWVKTPDETWVEVDINSVIAAASSI